MDNLANNLLSGGTAAFVEQYQYGVAMLLTRGIHTQGGSLLISERAIYSLHILYRMLFCNRDYELEPLCDDIFIGVHRAQAH